MGYHQTNNMERKLSGRPRKSTACQDRQMLKIVKAGSRKITWKEGYEMVDLVIYSLPRRSNVKNSKS